MILSDIEPYPSRDRLIYDEFRRQGVDEVDAAALTQFIVVHGLLSEVVGGDHAANDLSEHDEYDLTVVAHIFTKKFPGCRGAAWLDTYWRVLEPASRRRSSLPVLDAFILLLASPDLGLELHDALRALAGTFEKADKDIVCGLWYRELIDPIAVIGVESIRTPPSTVGNPHAQVADVRTPIYWLALDRALFLRSAERLLLEDRIAETYAGLSAWLDIYVQYRLSSESIFDSLWRNLAEPLKPHALGLIGHLENHHDDELLQQYVFRFASRAFFVSPGDLSDDARRRLLDASRPALARMRPLLRSAKDPEAADSFERKWRYYEEALMVLVVFGGLWDALKPLLLAFRALGALAVTSDLRYWDEANLPERAPVPWQRIPNSINAFIHTFIDRELATDPQANKLRENFAVYCLDRLKTKDRVARDKKHYTTGDMLEDSAEWRACYVRAARSLMVNPRGKGHQVLHWLSRNDPNEHVREEAQKAYRDLRHNAALPFGTSPRRPLFTAFWWLRQAHVLKLGGQIDAAGAQRTLRKELRRTAREEGRM